MKYELEDPIRLKGKSGAIMVEADVVELRPPKARDFVRLERAGLLKPGRETELSVELLKACGVPGEVADEMSLRDVQRAHEAMSEADFFGQGTQPTKAPATEPPDLG